MWTASLCALRLLTARHGPLRRWFPWLPSAEGCSPSESANASVNGTVTENYEAAEQEEAQEEQTASSRVGYVLIMLLNASIVGGVNGVYIHLSSQSVSASVLVALQLGMALFKLGWDKGVAPRLARPLRGAEQALRAELLLRVFNDVAIPCAVTALTSPACFQVAAAGLCVSVSVSLSVWPVD
jgi:hypothetical protein